MGVGSDLGENLSISLSVHHPEFGNYFTASLKVKKLCSSSTSDHAVYFWLMLRKIAVWIYWHVSFNFSLPSCLASAFFVIIISKNLSTFIELQF